MGALNIPALVAAAANQYGVKPSLALAVAQQESGMNQNARSSAGAIGVMQLMPATAAGLGVNPNDAAENIQGGVMYLAQQLQKYGGDVAKALAAYNWGPGNVDAAVNSAGEGWLSLAPGETQSYVAAIAGVTDSSVADTTAAASSDAGSSGGSADFSQLLPSLTSLDGGTVALLAGLGVGAWLLVNALLD